LTTILLESDIPQLNPFFMFLLILGKKGGHKGRMRTYTSPEEIDAQMKEEKERKKVSCIATKDRNANKYAKE